MGRKGRDVRDHSVTGEEEDQKRHDSSSGTATVCEVSRPRRIWVGLSDHTLPSWMIVTDRVLST